MSDTAGLLIFDAFTWFTFKSSLTTRTKPAIFIYFLLQKERHRDIIVDCSVEFIFQLDAFWLNSRGVSCGFKKPFKAFFLFSAPVRLTLQRCSLLPVTVCVFI